jgi:NAD(P)-dependent dehydrogenase (short-subunit alcohol dehydrogenase family)
LAAEGREHGISVFSISPEAVLTNSLRDAIEGTWGERPPALRDMLHGGRLSPPDRAAQLVMFLAAGKADILSGRSYTRDRLAYRHWGVRRVRAACARPS